MILYWVQCGVQKAQGKLLLRLRSNMDRSQNRIPLMNHAGLLLSNQWSNIKSECFAAITQGSGARKQNTTSRAKRHATNK